MPNPLSKGFPEIFRAESFKLVLRIKNGIDIAPDFCAVFVLLIVEKETVNENHPVLLPDCRQLLGGDTAGFGRIPMLYHQRQIDLLLPVG